MKVSIWKGGTYGIRVFRKDLLRFFDPRWKEVIIEIEGHSEQKSLSRTFWTTCPELRGGLIGKWIQTNGLTEWDKGHPPRVQLIPLGQNRFRLAH